MFDIHDYKKPIAVASMEDILNGCRNNEVIRYAIAEGWELLLPRLQMEVTDTVSGGRLSQQRQYFLECWWMRPSDGTLGYYAKINLLTGMVKEFRELPGDTVVIGDRASEAEKNYLMQCVAVLGEPLCSSETAAALDLLWQAAVPAQLRELALQKPELQTIGTYLLPLESLTCWNWEKLKTLLLKRYKTSVADILDYLEYKKSGSDAFYVEPKLRDMAREKGIRFWRDGNDS